jgi:hypothetical protein
MEPEEAMIAMITRDERADVLACRETVAGLSQPLPQMGP